MNDAQREIKSKYFHVNSDATHPVFPAKRSSLTLFVYSLFLLTTYLYWHQFNVVSECLISRDNNFAIRASAENKILHNVVGFLL
jgi:hypothetical protein